MRLPEEDVKGAFSSKTFKEGTEADIYVLYACCPLVLILCITLFDGFCLNKMYMFLIVKDKCLSNTYNGDHGVSFHVIDQFLKLTGVYC